MLTDTTVRQSKPKDKPYKLTDGGGLYLLINTTGKYWRLNYRFAGKQKTLALGVYPAVSLIDARQKRDQARSQLAKDIDPSESRKEQKLQKAIAANNSFEAVSVFGGVTGNTTKLNGTRITPFDGWKQIFSPALAINLLMNLRQLSL